MTAETPSAVAPPEPATPTTPALFRYRVWLMAAVFLSSSLLASATYGFVRFRLQPYISLDPRLWLASQVPLTDAPLWELLVPSVLIAAGMLLRTWGTSYLRGHIMLDRALHTERLIIAGPFRWCRNPLYLGNILVAAGFGLYLPAPGLLIAVILMAVAVDFLARAEGRALRLAYGAEYDAYAAKVNAFIPKPPSRALPAGSPVKPDWANGWRTEAWNGLLGLYLASLSLRQPGLAIAVLVVLVAGLTWTRRRNRVARTS